MERPPIQPGRAGAAAGSSPSPAEERSLPRRPPGRILTLGLVALLCGIWGSTWLVIRGGLVDLPPFTGAALRFLLAGTIFWLLAPRLARVEGGAPPGWRLSVAMGLLNVTLSYSIVYWSETVLPSGLVSLIWSIFPLMLAVLARFFLPDERLSPRQWLGLAAGLAGMALLFSTDLWAVAPGALGAGLILLLSPAASAVGNLYVKRHGAGTSSVLLNRNGMLLGGVLLSVLALATEDIGAARWTPAAIGSIVYLALFGTVLAFGLYFWLLRYAPTHQLGLIAYVVPLIALTLGAALAGEPVGGHTLTGAALILGGVALVLRRRGAHP